MYTPTDLGKQREHHRYDRGRADVREEVTAVLRPVRAEGWAVFVSLSERVVAK